MAVALTTAFIDLSSYDEIEVWMYGGRSVNLFRRAIIRSAWFSLVATQLNKTGSHADFGGEIQGYFSRSTDYILHCWLRATIPAVRAVAGTAGADHYATVPGLQPRWTKNLGHNLIDEASLYYGDVIVNKLNSYHLDFWRMFTLSASKTTGYDTMIGNTYQLYNPYFDGHPTAITAGAPRDLPSRVVNVPLPFFFCHDPSNAIIVAATPYNDIRVQVKFRKWEDLVTVDEIIHTADGRDHVRASSIGNINATSMPRFTAANTTTMKLSDVELWTHYVLTPNGDRTNIGNEEEIDQLIDQVQFLAPRPWKPDTSSSMTVDLRLAYSIRCLFFAVRNTTLANEWSNYTTHTPTPGSSEALISPSVDFFPYNADNIIKLTTIKYENVDRWVAPSDYSGSVAPFYFCPAMPTETGYHIISYSVNLAHIGAYGSTNFARLSSATLTVDATTAAVTQSSSGSTFSLILSASALNIWRSSGGAGGFPIL